MEALTDAQTGNLLNNELKTLQLARTLGTGTYGELTKAYGD